MAEERWREIESKRDTEIGLVATEKRNWVRVAERETGERVRERERERERRERERERERDRER